MTKLNIVTLAGIILASAAVAATAVEDQDGDGVYSMEELAAAYPDITEEVFGIMDVDGDGAVDADELAAAQEAGLIAS